MALMTSHRNQVIHKHGFVFFLLTVVHYSSVESVIVYQKEILVIYKHLHNATILHYYKCQMPLSHDMLSMIIIQVVKNYGYIVFFLKQVKIQAAENSEKKNPKYSERANKQIQVDLTPGQSGHTCELVEGGFTS